MCLEKKNEMTRLQRGRVDASIQGLKWCIKIIKQELITAVSNSNDNTKTNKKS